MSPKNFEPPILKAVPEDIHFGFYSADLKPVLSLGGEMRVSQLVTIDPGILFMVPKEIFNSQPR